MTEVAGHASSVADSPDHVRLSRIEVDMEAGAPGEAPERRHPSTHRLCGGKQIQHLPETTAAAPIMVKGLLAHLGPSPPCPCGSLQETWANRMSASFK